MKIKTVINPRFQDLEDFVENIHSAFESSGEILYAKRNVVKKFQVNGTEFTVKRYRIPNIVQRISYSTFRSSKAKRAYEYALRLQNLDIATPSPIAYVEVYHNALFAESYFFSLYTPLKDCKCLLEKEIESLERALASHLYYMVSRGFLHGDVNLSNILYKENPDGGYSFSVIDINRSRFSKQMVSKQDVVKMLMRLTHERPLLLRLLKYYAEESTSWNVNELQAAVFAALLRFQRKKDFLHKFK